MSHFIQAIIHNFRSTKALGDKTISQLNRNELMWQPTTESNSIAIIVKHLYGNMKSRWTDFLVTDGEKENRNRDSEFELVYKNKEALLAEWEAGWEILFSTLSSLSEEDLQKTITIRGEIHSVVEAMLRQVSHYAYHVGQIVYIGKQLKNEEFQCLSIPKPANRTSNKEKFTGKAESYTKYRPGYPQSLFNYLVDEEGLTNESVVADIGAGTGIFTKELMNVSHFVYAVEPNDEMREVCESFIAGNKNVALVNGSGESTTLVENSVDFITVAQAFHWFDQEKAKQEFKRILKQDGKVVLVWNSRDGSNDFVKENDLLFQRICPKFKGFSGGAFEDKEMFSRFFREGIYTYKQFDNHLSLHLEAFLGRCLSASYAPVKGDRNYDLFIEELTDLFHTYSVDDIVIFPQFTRVYVGCV